MSRRLATLFAPLAAANSGDVKAATVLALPVLRFERDGRRYVVGAMASGGPLVSGTASRPGFNGPFTFANLELPFDTGQELRIQRSDKLDRGISRTIASVTNGQRPTSGDDEFDNMYLIKTRDQAFARLTLDPPLRKKLIDSPHQCLEVALNGAKISVHIHDYANSPSDLDEMIDIATRLANNCNSS